MAATSALSGFLATRVENPTALFAAIALLCAFFSVDDLLNLHQDYLLWFAGVYMVLWGVIYGFAIPYVDKRFIWPLLAFGMVMASSIIVDRAGYILPMRRFHGLWSISVLLEDSLKLSGSVILFLTVLNEFLKRDKRR